MTTRVERYLLPASNMSLRGLALAARFGLTIYLAQLLGYRELGIFALVQGTAGILPPLVGWGVNYFLNREIVDLPKLSAGRLLRDRLILTAASLVATLVAFGVVAIVGIVSAPQPFALIALIISLEAFAFDIHLSLISLGMPIAANALLFLRSAAWVIPAVVLGIYFPALRTLDVVYWLWLSGLALNFLALIPLFRNWPIAAILRSRPDVGRVVRRLREGWLIYLNDVAIVGTLYLDRFVVNHFLGLQQTGKFALYWSVANGVHILVTTAVIQMSLPTLLRAYSGLGYVGWLATLRSEAFKVVIIGVPLLALTFGVAVFVLPAFGIVQFAAEPLLFALMLASVAVRLLADIFSYGLYSRGLDRQFAAINISGVLISLTLSTVMILAWGLFGIGVAMICTPLILLASRVVILFGSGNADMTGKELSR